MRTDSSLTPFEILKCYQFCSLCAVSICPLFSLKRSQTVLHRIIKRKTYATRTTLQTCLLQI
ncbi:unnamed protein product [Acanthoscelides obtectus]|uniref:Uncharacterized protein n=1 Tax=Acanthoscelides obtectus TaxID=200917 RepID=A0A9P0Q4K2_ACAOB|nr:unnamed protein product [Acanthoscelides obtectus]CAK1659891.1 hypothetical protein AOBTE_LOCUS21734 [Acanthoscelides obtectus]